MAATDAQTEEKQPLWTTEWGPQYSSPYEQWKAQQGLDTVRGWIAQNLYTIDVKEWPARGAKGVFINLEGNEGFNDSYVCEIPPGKSTLPMRHIYEDTIFILKGRGATSVWYEESKKQTFEWKDWSYFALPPNAWYQHHNGSGTEPARFVGMTAAPRVINTFKDLDFIFENPYRFKDRFDDQAGYFGSQPSEGKVRDSYKLVTNFVADVEAVTARADQPKAMGPRGVRTTGVRFEMINSTMKSHSSEWPVGTYMNCHRHGPGLHIIILRSKGYSLLWKDDYADRVRVDYGPGSMFVPPEMYWHQHFNTGPVPLLHLAAGWGSEKPKAGGGAYYYIQQGEAGDSDAVWGGEDVINIDQENPAIHKEFEEELAKNGVPCNMGHVHPYCSFKD